MAVAVGEGKPQVWRVVDPRAPVVEHDVRKEGGREGGRGGGRKRANESRQVLTYTIIYPSFPPSLPPSLEQMFDVTPFVEMFRNSAPYISMHR